MDTGFERLTTPRLVIRRFIAADAEAFAAYRSVPDVARFQSWDAPYPIERAREFIAWLEGHHPDEPGEWYQLAIGLAERPDALIGDLALHPHADEPGVVDIGFTLAPGAQGRGYAAEAVTALLGYLFEHRGKHRVAADCDTRNERSAALLRRAGFREEGVLRECFRDGGAWADLRLFAFLAGDWRAPRLVTTRA
jgi:aminoglycoside 6'-N-acetyltransferase